MQAKPVSNKAFAALKAKTARVLHHVGSTQNRHSFTNAFFVRGEIEFDYDPGTDRYTMSADSYINLGVSGYGYYAFRCRAVELVNSGGTIDVSDLMVTRWNPTTMANETVEDYIYLPFAGLTDPSGDFQYNSITPYTDPIYFPAGFTKEVIDNYCNTLFIAVTGPGIGTFGGPRLGESGVFIPNYGGITETDSTVVSNSLTFDDTVENVYFDGVFTYHVYNRNLVTGVDTFLGDFSWNFNAGPYPNRVTSWTTTNNTKRVVFINGNAVDIQ